MTAKPKRVTVAFLTGRVIELEAELKKLRKRCARCREEQTPAIGFRLEDNQDPDDDEEPVSTTPVAGTGPSCRVR